MKTRAQGPRAARLRQRKFDLLAALRIPPEALPGSLSLTSSTCGKPTCHCRSSAGHPGWVLTFTVHGKKRVERVPREWVEEVRRRVEEGRAFKEAVAEVFVANAELLVLTRRQRLTRRR
ncbi:MAG TPA: DUF6788 family protein [Planctomycetota bacterium]|nr:DUF6788 family protein [Planctomycetota bacterium]